MGLARRPHGSIWMWLIGSDYAGAEDDRRHVPLARRSEAHDEPHRAGGSVPLVVMRDDRRVEQRRRSIEYSAVK